MIVVATLGTALIFAVFDFVMRVRNNHLLKRVTLEESRREAERHIASSRHVFLSSISHGAAPVLSTICAHCCAGRLCARATSRRRWCWLQLTHGGAAPPSLAYLLLNRDQNTMLVSNWCAPCRPSSTSRPFSFRSPARAAAAAPAPPPSYVLCRLLSCRHPLPPLPPLLSGGIDILRAQVTDPAAREVLDIMTDSAHHIMQLARRLPTHRNPTTRHACLLPVHFREQQA